MRRIKLAEHLRVEEIEKRYRSANDGVGRSQWQIIWLLAQGKTSSEIEAMMGYSLTWIRTIARRYNSEGAEGIGDKRHSNPGRKAALTDSQQQELKAVLNDALANNERWGGREVAAWMSKELGQAVYVQRGYEWLAKLEFSGQVPRPHHANANAEEQRVFKKTSRTL